MKHFHLYRAGARDRKRGPVRFFATNGKGHWSRAAANLDGKKNGREFLVRQCELDGCPMVKRYKNR